VLAVLCVFVIVSALLHFHFLPKWSGAYNRSCYLSKTEEENLAYLLTNVIDACKVVNLTYWLDYGTLLGAIRHGAVLPWDGDGDISVLHPGYLYDAEPWISYLGNRGIDANMMIATYKGMTVDIVRWKLHTVHHHGLNIANLYKYYPPNSGDSFIVKLSHKLETFPYDWIEPRKLVDFHGIQAHVPFQALKLLNKRYPLSLQYRIPYKWKCWLPWFDGKVKFGQA